MTIHKTSDEKAEEIMELTKDIYVLNFKTGIEVERFRWLMVFLISLLGGAIGAGLGGVLDYADNKYKLYNQLLGYISKKQENK